jgi:hypothetical protein
MSPSMKSWCAATTAVSGNNGDVEDLKGEPHRLTRIFNSAQSHVLQPAKAARGNRSAVASFCPRFIPPLGQDREDP